MSRPPSVNPLKPVAIFNDTRTDRGHYGCALVMDNLDHHLTAYGLDTVFALPFNQDWTQAKDRLPKPGSVRALIVNGEGTLHSSAKRPKVRNLAKLGHLARDRYGVPAFLINATITRNEPDVYHDFKAFDRIYVRDGMSAEDLARFGILATITPDLSLSRPWTQPIGPREGIGVTDSVLVPDDRALRAFAAKGGHAFRPMTEPRVTPVSSRMFLRPELVLRKLREMAGPQDIRHADHQDFIRWIASKELILTGRYHTVTMCLLTRTPFLCLESNTPKISALIRDAGLDPHRVITGLPVENDPAMVRPFSEAEKSNLDRYLAKALTASQTMFSDIAGAIN